MEFPTLRNVKNAISGSGSPSSSRVGSADDEPTGPVAQRFFAAVDRTVAIQEPVIRGYVQRIQGKHGNKSLAEQQKVLDAHFTNLATGSGAGTGGLAAVPGIGTLASLAGIAGESLLLIEVCALYSLASAELHGVDISDPETRRAVVYLAISGATGKDLVAALTADSTLGSAKSLRNIARLARSNKSELLKINSVLGRAALRQLRKRFGGAMVQKIMPFGIGAVLGAKANRKIAQDMVRQVHVFVDGLDVVDGPESH